MPRSAPNKRGAPAMIQNRRDARSLPLSRSVTPIAAVFLCAGAPAAWAAPLPAHQSYSISEFDAVRLEAPLDVAVTTDTGVSASATGDRDTLDRIELRVNSRTLIIRLRNAPTLGGSGDGGRGRVPTHLSLSTNLVQHATVMGSGMLAIDRLKGARVDATLSGSGHLTIPRVEADRINVGLAGSGVMTLTGTVLEAIVTMSGSGRLEAAPLLAQRLRIDTEGSGDAQLSARETAAATANGTGQITITGKAVCTVRKTGSASITCGGQVF